MNISQAKEIVIADYLRLYGFTPTKIQGDNLWYCSPLRHEKTPSFKVSQSLNCWYDHGIGRGGNIIDLIMSMHRLNNISDALRHLTLNPPLDNSGSFSFQQQNTHPVIAGIETKEITHPALIDYLTERKINTDIARNYCREAHYTIDGQPYFAIGFKNDAGGYELRNRYFKGSSAPKDITTIQNHNGQCLLFEGFMDFLSYLTLKKLTTPQQDIVILNSVAHLSKAMNFIKRHDQLFTFLDNDDAGKRALEEVRKQIPNTSNQSAFYAKYKDLNECLCKENRKKQERLKPGFRMKR